MIRLYQIYYSTEQRKHPGKYSLKILKRLSNNIFSIGAIRKIISGYVQYLDQVKPQYVCYIPYNEGYENRHKYYGMILKRLGYNFIGKYRDKLGYDYYYYEKEIT